MAGLTASRTRSIRAKPWTKTCNDLPPEEAKEIPQVAGSLEEALNQLDLDREVPESRWRVHG
ncbi:hypothetical protein ACNKHN_22215 [Shigella flexneri]